MHKILFLICLLCGCAYSDTIPLNNVETVETCSLENEKCFMENHFNVGICDQNLICLECDGLHLSEIVQDQKSCLQMQCQLNPDNIKYGHLVYSMIKGCK